MRTYLDRAVADEAHLLRSGMMKTLTMGGRVAGGSGEKWPRLKRITLEMRRNASRADGRGTKGSKPLVRTGSLRNSISVHKKADAQYFVGVHRSTQSADGQSMVNIAALHERGPYVIPITDKMRSYFMFLYVKGVIKKVWPPPGKTHIFVPARRFAQPTFEAWSKGAPDRIMQRMAGYVFRGRKVKLRFAGVRR